MSLQFRSLWSVAPLLLIPVVLGLVWSFEPPARDGAVEVEVGTVVNGERAESTLVAEIERRLDESEPSVLVLGNSYALTNVVPERIARGLGIRVEEVLVLAVPNTVSSHWYAILKNRVYARGHRPDLVLIVGSMQSMLLAEPYSEASYVKLMEQLEDSEPVLERYIDRQDQRLTDWRVHRVGTRDWLLRSVRDTALAGVFGLSARDTEASMHRTFHLSRVATDGRAADFLLDEDLLLDPEHSLVPELCKLADGYGSKLVLLRSPVAPRTPSARRDPVPEGFEQRMERDGHLFLDMIGYNMRGSMFKNLTHMTRKGAKRFTTSVNVALQEVWEDLGYEA